MRNDDRVIDAETRARALSRWEGEGGALAPTGAAASIDESEMRILARLGAALLDEWGRLSPTLQKDVVHRARTLGAPEDHQRIKEQLAHLVREYQHES
jgi:hypothetical protein